MLHASGRRDAPVTLGWKEYLDLPELGLHRLKAKIDTGARTSSLHVASILTLEEHDDGSAELEITLLPHRRRPQPPILARTRMLRRVRVTDSGGHSELRPLIATEMLLGPVRKKIEITLTDRGSMLFRMILGRRALAGDFLVDVSQKYLLRDWHPPVVGAPP